MYTKKIGRFIIKQICLMDYVNNKSIRVPDLWRSLIGEFETT
jgi:hypothetical protein